MKRMKKREAIILCSILVLLLIVSAGMAILVGRTGKQANKQYSDTMDGNHFIPR